MGKRWESERGGGWGGDPQIEVQVYTLSPLKRKLSKPVPASCPIIEVNSTGQGSVSVYTLILT